MKGPLVAFGAGVVIGVLVTVLVATFASASLGHQEFWKGVGYGFGAGFGAVAALGLLNALVTYLDKLASGRA